ncbi:MAG: glycosyltransferase family 4 protein [Muribaculaceae bacterium]|nr:glycosyltransferase family 4 protein [Muribaculaceae bacterium]
MKIGYDAKRAVNNNTGLGNYSRLVIDTIASSGDDSLLLYAPQLRPNKRLMPLLERENVTLCLPDSHFARHFRSLWRSYGVTSQLRRDEIDLFHGLSNELPLNIASSGIPSVVTIHDVIFRHFPRCYKPIDRTIYDYKFARAARNATRVIAISECTRRDIIDFYGISPEKIDVVYQGCDPQFAHPVDHSRADEVKSKYAIDRPYIVGVGTVEERKNQLLTIKSLRGLPDDIIAVIVGRRTRYAAEIDRFIAANGLHDRVRFVENADFADFPALYAGALFSSYPSRYEGFGIPVIESLSVGTPVIIASGSCLEEAAGPDAPVVAPDDVDAYIAFARRIIDDHDYRIRLVDAGQAHITRFSRQNFADGLRASYDKALQCHGL